MVGTNTITVNPEQLRYILEAGVRAALFESRVSCDPHLTKVVHGKFYPQNYIKGWTLHESGCMSIVIGDRNEDRQTPSSGTEEQKS